MTQTDLLQEPAKTRSGTELKRAVAGKSQPESVLALSVMRIRFLDMGHGFRPNFDI